MTEKKYSRRFQGIPAGVVFALASCLLTLAVFSGCAKQQAGSGQPGWVRPYKVAGNWYKPMKTARGFSQTGLASWYGEPFHGRKTANGETYDMNKLTAAHKTLPLGVWVKVRNLKNGRSVTVRVNDRGPFVKGRIIDLSRAAAREIDMLKKGTAKVEVTALGTAAAGGGYKPMDYYTGRFTVQVGAFEILDNARGLKQKLDADYKNAHIITYRPAGKNLYRVRVGLCKTFEQAQKYEAIMERKGYEDAFMVAE